MSWLKTEGAALQSNNNDVYQENGTHFPVSDTIGGPQEVWNLYFPFQKTTRN